MADVKSLRFDNEAFDAVVIANALHVMPDPELAVAEINRVVKKGGLVICPTFTRESMKSRGIELFLEFIGFKTFSRWTHDSYKAFLEANGCRIIQDRVIAGYSFPISFVVYRKE